MCLYEVLKGLIGTCSISHGALYPNRQLKLGALPLLLAAQLACYKADMSLFSSYTWESDGLVEIMQHREQHEAQQAIRAMATFVSSLGLSPSGTNQVLGVSWGSVPGNNNKHLWIDIAFDPLDCSLGRSLLQTLYGARWGNGKGKAIEAYEKMMESARTINGEVKKPSFSLCIYPVTIDNQRITRLDFRATL